MGLLFTHFDVSAMKKMIVVRTIETGSGDDRRFCEEDETIGQRWLHRALQTLLYPDRARRGETRTRWESIQRSRAASIAEIKLQLFPATQCADGKGKVNRNLPVRLRVRFGGRDGGGEEEEGRMGFCSILICEMIDAIVPSFLFPRLTCIA